MWVAVCPVRHHSPLVPSYSSLKVEKKKKPSVGKLAAIDLPHLLIRTEQSMVIIGAFQCGIAARRL